MASSSLGGTRWRITEEHHITVTGGFKKNKMLLYSQNDDSSSDSITLFQMLVDTNVYRSRDELTLAWCEELKCSLQLYQPLLSATPMVYTHLIDPLAAALLTVYLLVE